MSVRIDRKSRSSALDALRETTAETAEPLDILIVGGGITGAGIALDAAARGLRVAIIDSQDWGEGTSSRSSKLVHGGLRYLKMLDFRLVYEALTERDLLIETTAPHLVRPVPFLFPLTHRIWERVFIGAGIALYDALAILRRGRRQVPWHRHLSKRGMLRAFGGLNPRAAVGAITYWDATVDDARLVMAVLRTAAGRGALCASRARMVSMSTDESGWIDGGRVIDLETNEEFDVRARTVINATGAWTENVQYLSESDGGLRVTASKGIHIVVSRDRIAGSSGLILQTPTSVLFVIPWSRYWIVGTTDTPWTAGADDPLTTSADIDYVIEQANRVLAEPLTRADVIGTWSGLRPLLKGTKTGTASTKVSREHAIASPKPGLISIAGGKLTTYRVMAADAVDFAIGPNRARQLRSTTEAIPLVGAVEIDRAQARLKHVAGRFGWSDALCDHLIHRYGSDVLTLITICESDPDLAAPVQFAEAYIRAEIVFAARYEGVLHLPDIMQRRTRLDYEYPDHGRAAATEIATIAAAELEWSISDIERELADYSLLIDAYEAASQQPTDETAAAAAAAVRATHKSAG